MATAKKAAKKPAAKKPAAKKKQISIFTINFLYYRLSGKRRVSDTRKFCKT